MILRTMVISDQRQYISVFFWVGHFLGTCLLHAIATLHDLLLGGERWG